MQTVSHITINLLTIPDTGSAAIIPRVTMEDRNKINRAALAIGMSQAQFMRTVLVRAAEQVLEEVK